METAWKMAIQYHVANGQPERRKAIARETAYHGATIGALSLTGLTPMKEPFGTPAIPVRRMSNTNRFRSPYAGDDTALTAFLLRELEEAILEEGPETVAAIIAEPQQNAGGCFVPPEGYWTGLREIADRHGILLIADARKTRRRARVRRPRQPTRKGHRRMTVDTIASRMRDLMRIPIVGDVRGCGFLWAAEMVRERPDTPFEPHERAELVGRLIPDRLRARGIIARADDRGHPVVQIAPPLVSSRAELDELVDGLADALEAASSAMLGVA